MPSKQYDDALLRQLRNEIPIDHLIEHLRWPCRRRDGQFVFVCPRCGESRSDVNPDTNLARCFCCETNFNPIDFTMCARQWEFVETVEFLKPLLRPG